MKPALGAHRVGQWSKFSYLDTHSSISAISKGHGRRAVYTLCPTLGQDFPGSPGSPELEAAGYQQPRVRRNVRFAPHVPGLDAHSVKKHFCSAAELREQNHHLLICLTESFLIRPLKCRPSTTRPAASLLAELLANSHRPRDGVMCQLSAQSGPNSPIKGGVR